MNDADIEMAHLQSIADRESDLARQGICCHGHIMAPPEEKLARCVQCGKVATWEELMDERDERMG
jgi:hypothetical protein